MIFAEFSKDLAAVVVTLFKYTDSYLINLHLTCYRSSHRGCSVRKGVLKIFSKFTGKHLCQSLLFNKASACNFIKKETLAQVFSCEFSKISKDTFFIEHLWATASFETLNYALSEFPDGYIILKSHKPGLTRCQRLK